MTKLGHDAEGEIYINFLRINANQKTGVLPKIL